MDDKMLQMCRISALLAFGFCFTAGLWILTKTGLAHGNDALTTGIGLYFLGKAFFVGPMLYLATLRLSRADRGNAQPVQS
jgi:hypothetical protein